MRGRLESLRLQHKCSRYLSLSQLCKLGSVSQFQRCSTLRPNSNQDMDGRISSSPVPRYRISSAFLCQHFSFTLTTASISTQQMTKGEPSAGQESKPPSCKFPRSGHTSVSTAVSTAAFFSTPAGAACTRHVSTLGFWLFHQVFGPSSELVLCRTEAI